MEITKHIKEKEEEKEIKFDDSSYFFFRAYSIDSIFVSQEPRAATASAKYKHKHIK